MNVLIVPEDPRYDQYILKPLFEKLFRSSGKANARVRVCQNPVLGGVGEALKAERIAEIVDRYRAMVDVFILCVDRDGVEGRRQQLDALENRFNNGCVFLAENAWEEIETWVLAGLKDLPKNWNWSDIRAEVDVKERYFIPLIRGRSLDSEPGRGRKELGKLAASRIDRIRRRCPEDFDRLAKRIEKVIAGSQSE